MTTDRVLRQTLVSLVDGDLDLLEHLCAAGLVPREEDDLRHEHAETARVVAILVHELDVNRPGGEVILRLRSEILATHRQVGELLVWLKERGPRR